jgi:predicted ArsR family transcriptional regulator
MQKIMEENTTRRKLIMLLKKCGSMSTEQLSNELKITPMGIRQHLLALENKGYVTYEAERKGIGRPGFKYKLTEQADSLFPKLYHLFLLDFLEEIEKREGREKIDKLFRWRKENLYRKNSERINGDTALPVRIKRMAEKLEEEGYLVEIEEDSENFFIKQYNCPISMVSKKYRESCKHELDLYRKLLNTDVTRIQCLSDGAPACVYSVPKNHNN